MALTFLGLVLAMCFRGSPQLPPPGEAVPQPNNAELANQRVRTYMTAPYGHGWGSNFGNYLQARERLYEEQRGGPQEEGGKSLENAPYKKKKDWYPGKA